MDVEDAADPGDVDLVSALSGRGLVAVVGAGGKKTTLWRLAERHDRVVVTAATRIPTFEERVAELAVTDDPVGAVEWALEREAVGESPWPLGLVPGRADEVRYEGYGAGTVSALADAVGGDLDAILLKADGARNRLFKAPDEHEPQVPERADTVLPIASARAVGEPLGEERVHRPELVAEIARMEPGEVIEPVHVARVLASERGGLKRVPEGATVVPLVNMCDDEALARIGRDVAEEVLERAAVPRVVLARMDCGRVVDVVE
ncbi:MAG: selenium cofactor biosynthesis protein YqeC [Haloarculaceae archaeon]